MKTNQMAKAELLFFASMFLTMMGVIALMGFTSGAVMCLFFLIGVVIFYYLRRKPLVSQYFMEEDESEEEEFLEILRRRMRDVEEEERQENHQHLIEAAAGRLLNNQRTTLVTRWQLERLRQEQAERTRQEVDASVMMAGEQKMQEEEQESYRGLIDEMVAESRCESCPAAIICINHAERHIITRCYRCNAVLQVREKRDLVTYKAIQHDLTKLDKWYMGEKCFKCGTKIESREGVRIEEENGYFTAYCRVCGFPQGHVIEQNLWGHGCRSGEKSL